MTADYLDELLSINVMRACSEFSVIVLVVLVLALALAAIDNPTAREARVNLCIAELSIEQNQSLVTKIQWTLVFVLAL